MENMETEEYLRVSDDEGFQQRWWNHLLKLEASGYRLTYFRVHGGAFDEERDCTTWRSVTVQDWRTDETLATYDPEQFSNLDYGRERWVDVEGRFE